MAGADGGQQRLWDLSRRAASFLRMARLALTGAAAPAQLLAEEEVVDGHSCNPYYKSVSTEDDDLESGERWIEEHESSELLVDDEDGSTTTRGVSENSTLVCGGGALSKKGEFVRHQPDAAAGAAALRPENIAAASAAAQEESSEPLVPRRRAAKLVNDAEMVHHPFGCDRRGSESSSLLLVSS